jgi:peptidoglycan-N-acetylglucosamine deacetylase
MITVRWPRPLVGLLTAVLLFAAAGSTPGGAQTARDSGGILSEFGTAPELHPGADFDIGPDTPVVGMDVTPDGDGLWLADSTGAIYRFGTAGFHGSTSGEALSEPIVGMAASPSGDGYWLVAADGGIFGFGDAGFYGSTGDLDLVEPIVGMAASPSGDGYWLVAADGGIFGFGDAGFHGSAADGRLGDAEAVAIAPHSQAGYWVAAGGGQAEAGPVRYEPDPGHVALTFDDGPHPTWTPAVLDILDDAGVEATFFVVGEEVERHPDLVADILRRGHSVQNHSHTHADLTELSEAAVEAELQQTDDAIVAAGGSPSECYRPPYGAYDSRVSAVADRLALEAILWDRDTRDWAQPGVVTIVDRATRATSGEIILLHDGSGDRRQTVSALPEIIDDLRAQGYGFQALCTPGGSTTTTAEQAP